MRNRTKQLILPLLALAGILLTGILSLMNTAPAHAADGAGTVYKELTGIKLDSSIAYSKVRTITFANTIPTGTTCWDAGVNGYATTVKACATKSTEDSSMWDVTYGADGAYPKFPADSTNLFGSNNVTNRHFSNLVAINGLNQIDTSNVTNMYGMFSGCSKVTQLDVSKFNTSNVTDMADMFENCSSLTELDLSSFNTSNVTNMKDMFNWCTKLTELDVSKFDTSNVTNMEYMFYECKSLPELDVSKFDTSKVTDMSSMFYGCSKVTQLDVSKWDTANVTDMYGMFRECSSLSTLDVSKWNTGNVTNMGTMFQKCSSLATLDVSKWDTSNVTIMYWLFTNCSSLTELDVSKWDTSNVTNMECMFWYCSSLAELDVSNFDTSNVTNMGYMFSGCSSLTELDVSNFDTSNVTDMDSMFSSCSKVTQLDVSKFDTSNVTNMVNMFARCKSLTSLDLSNFNTSKLGADSDNYSSMLYTLSSLQTLKLGADFTKNPGSDCRLGSPYAPAKTGYTVTGKWKDSATSVAYASSAIPTKTAATYVADYAPNTYTIQFDRNNGSGTMSDQSFTYDKAQNLTLNTFTRSGWKFTGWKDEAGKTYTDGQEVKNLTATNNASFVLTAQWEPDTYTVTFDPNNGTGTMDSQTVTYNTEQTLTLNTFTHDGWYFTGWNTSKDGTGTTYADGEKIVNLTTAGNTITLYAQWKHVNATMPTTGNGHLLPLLIITSIIGMVTAIILLRKQD